MSVPNSRKLPKKPRRLSGAYSAMKVEAPPYSPPVEKPWSIRKKMSRTAAQTPMVPWEGMRPIAKVPTAMRIMVRARTFLRPILSPIGPKNMPPRGRTRKATAKVANDERSWVVSFPEGKKTCPMVTAR